MRKINDFLVRCALAAIYAICFVIAFMCNSILFIPFASIVIIFATLISLFCIPAAIVLSLIWVLIMIARSIVDVYVFSKIKSKS